MRCPSVIPLGSWPRRMPAELAAGYCGEATVEAFIKRVGSEYPQPNAVGTEFRNGPQVESRNESDKPFSGVS